MLIFDRKVNELERHLEQLTIAVAEISCPIYSSQRGGVEFPSQTLQKFNKIRYSKEQLLEIWQDENPPDSENCVNTFARTLHTASRY